MLGVRDPAAAFDEFFGEMIGRLPLPRRMRDRMRLVLAAQRRLERGQVSTLKRRELFPDAAHLFELRLRALGRGIPDWLYDYEQRELPPPRRGSARG
jgi:hypothetical protein